MTCTPSDDVVPNYGKGLVTYITADMGTNEIKSDNVSEAIEGLVHFPVGQKLYIRPTWREVQPRPGRNRHARLYEVGPAGKEPNATADHGF